MLGVFSLLTMGNSNSAHVEHSSEEQPLSYMKMVQKGYEEIINAIIRPPRSSYEMTMLGPKSFNFFDRTINRVDFSLRNRRALALRCSLWECSSEDRAANGTHVVRPCIIYMHGNSSSRLESLVPLTTALKMGCSFLSFDFTGSGLSEGEYVSLGFFEKDDLDIVITFLKNRGRTSTIALWGRSMGAATALLHGERDPSIAAMILDSPFTELSSLAEDLVNKVRAQGYLAPSVVVSVGECPSTVR